MTVYDDFSTNIYDNGFHMFGAVCRTPEELDALAIEDFLPDFDAEWRNEDGEPFDLTGYIDGQGIDNLAYENQGWIKGFDY